MPRTELNDGASSICTQTAFARIRYHWFGEDSHDKVVPALRALITEIDMPQADRERLTGEMMARLKALTRAELKPIRHVVGPMDTVTGIDIFEVRGGVEYGVSETAQLRIYHVEPTHLQKDDGSGSTVVGLRAHHKVIEDGIDPNVAQNDELQRARQRYFAGKGDSWGGATRARRI